VAEAVLRFTVVDGRGTVSFVGPGHALKMLAAACCRGPADSLALLRQAERYDGRFAGGVLAGLAVFDEHNTPEDHQAIRRHLDETARDETPPFRVVDEATRRWSLEPARGGLVVFNLLAHRIVQVQNSYGELARSGLGRIRAEGKPTRQLYRYDLPAEWTILP
jgi:hypothetical protein